MFRPDQAVTYKSSKDGSYAYKNTRLSNLKTLH